MSFFKCLVFLYFASVSVASSASITAKSWEADASNYSRLTISISGPIEKGDAKKVEKLIAEDGNHAFDDWHDRVAVLDSLGGSFEEAIALMRLFHEQAISTYVPANAKCLSACALAFMAGTDSSVYFRTTNRVLHPKGELGFHAPSLNFPNNVEVPGSGRLLNQTYASALRSIAQIVDQMEALLFEESLLSVMLETSPNDMYMIETIDDVNRWKIQLDVDPPAKISRKELAQLCVFFKDWNIGASVVNEQSKGASVENEQSDWINESDIKSKPIKGATVYYFTVNGENDNTCYVKQVKINQAIFEVFYSTSSPESVIDSIATSNLMLDPASAQHLLLPQKEIKLLPSTSLRMKLPNDTDDPNTSMLFCEQFKGQTRVKVSSCLKYLKDGKFYFRWEDGSETVTQNNGKLFINGAEAGIVKLPNDRLCWRNRKTGETFCASETRRTYKEPSASLVDFTTAERNFTGDCKQGKRWSSQVVDGTPKTVYVGLYHCVYLDEYEGQPAPLEFTCSPGDDIYTVQSAIGMPHATNGQQVFFQIDRLGLLLEGRGEHNEMTGENDLTFEIPPHHELIDSLATGTSAEIRAGNRKLAIHLKDSKKALRYLELCRENSSVQALKLLPLNKKKSSVQYTEILGTWTGIAKQPNARDNSQYKVVLDIFKKNDQLEFTTYYPELMCRGVGMLLSHDQKVFRFKERISSGRSRCIDGVFHLTIVETKRAKWNWGAGIATAKLHKND